MHREVEVRAATTLLAFWYLSILPAAAQGRSLKGLDVCKLVPGENIAKAVAGQLAEARSVVAPDGTAPRCIYQVMSAGGQKPVRAAYVIYLYPPSDFQELRRYTEGKIVDVTGLGDGAYAFHDPGDGRFKIRVLKRDDVTIEASADSAEGARKVANAALASLKKSK